MKNLILSSSGTIFHMNNEYPQHCKAFYIFSLPCWFINLINPSLTKLFVRINITRTILNADEFLITQDNDRWYAPTCSTEIETWKLFRTSRLMSNEVSGCGNFDIEVSILTGSNVIARFNLFKQMRHVDRFNRIKGESWGSSPHLHLILPLC